MACTLQGGYDFMIHKQLIKIPIHLFAVLKSKPLKLPEFPHDPIAPWGNWIMNKLCILVAKYSVFLFAKNSVLLFTD
jgi:hypothetical protein